MLAEEFWDRWLNKRGGPVGGWLSRDVAELFREAEEMMRREFEELYEKAPKELVREKTLPDGSKIREWGPFVCGYSITIGPDGKPQVREFGNVKPGTRLGRPRIDIREEREPLVDVVETDGEIKVVAEVPGVEKEEIKLYGTETTLTISVETLGKKYYKELELPAKVNTKETKTSYNNGVLEITLRKRKDEKFKGELITL